MVGALLQGGPRNDLHLCLDGGGAFVNGLWTYAYLRCEERFDQNSKSYECFRIR